ncbi:MAG: hypothetical protein J3Q66DRAFT_362866 [Benniella sp.]|nr:MAG: hypothetical protein J3Q66DRAFT_362866 [Benniella sp.]
MSKSGFRKIKASECKDGEDLESKHGTAVWLPKGSLSAFNNRNEYGQDTVFYMYFPISHVLMLKLDTHVYISKNKGKKWEEMMDIDGITATRITSSNFQTHSSNRIASTDSRGIGSKATGFGMESGSSTAIETVKTVYTDGPIKEGARSSTPRFNTVNVIATESEQVPVSGSGGPGVPNCPRHPEFNAVKGVADDIHVPAENIDFTHAFGSKVIKMFLAVHVFTTNQRCGVGPLTEERRKQTAAIRNLRAMNKSIGCSYLCLGPEISIWEFALVHDLQGYTSFGQYLHDYRSSLTAANVDVGPGSPEIRQVEGII